MDYKLYFGTLLTMFNNNEMIEVRMNNQRYRASALTMQMEDHALHCRVVKLISRNFDNIVVYL